jgi:glycosidase
MGVWQRSPASRQEALRHSGLRQEYDRILPGWTEADIAGSPYAILNYSLDPALGRPNALSRLKTPLNNLGLGLILDFVPNHVARDHHWTLTHPDWFIPGSQADLSTHTDWFFPAGSVHLAHGRDPYFPPWSDTAQNNFYSPELRQTLIGELLKITRIADGVRCDMAMLALNEIFEKVWGAVLKETPRPHDEFWPEAIGWAKQARPGFIFLAEAYWGLEARLQGLGFDFTYDKTLYDRLLAGDIEGTRHHLTADLTYQERCARFIENHDEPRAIAAFGKVRSLAAAAVICSLPGLRLFFDGQLEGKSRRVPVQMVREPEEPTDNIIAASYERLMEIFKAPVFHDGNWGYLDTGPFGDDSGFRRLLAGRWQLTDQHRIVITNYSADAVRGYVKLPSASAAESRSTFVDLLSGDELRTDTPGSDSQVYVKLLPYQSVALSPARRV